MSLVGRLEDLALSDIFQIISLSKKTGTLVLKSRSGAAVVVFKNGQIVQAATDNLRDTLGNILISRGLITEADLSAALEIQRGLKGSKRLGQILVEQGRIPQGTLESAIREQIENMVYSLLAWDDGFFNFEVGEVAPSDKIEVSTQEFLLKSGGLNPEYLLMESARVQDEKKRISGPRPVAAPSGDPKTETVVARAVSEFSEFLEEQGLAPHRPVSGEEEAAALRSRELSTLKSMFEELRFPSATAEITLLVLRYASEMVGRAVLFMVTRDEVRGLGQFGVEPAGGSADQRVRHIRVPAAETSIFTEVVKTGRTKVGSFSESAWDAYLIKELGGREPGEFFLVPLVCNGRVAAVLYGDNLPEAKPLPALTGLEIFLHQAGLAMEKALLERRLTELEGEKAKGR